LPHLSDSSLVARCIKRDRLAWNKFVEQFSPLVFWAIKDKLSCAGYAFNRQDIEDIFQNVFVVLWEKGKLKQIRDHQKISAWLVMVAANSVHNFFRNKRETLARGELLPDEIASADCGAAETINQEKSSNMIEGVLNFLSARERIILKLNYLYDKTHQEIGRILKMPTNTVSSVIKRSKERLRVQLKKQDRGNS